MCSSASAAAAVRDARVAASTPLLLLLLFLLSLILSEDQIEFVGHLLQSGLASDGRNRLRNLPFWILDVQLRIRIGAVPIPTSVKVKGKVETLAMG